MARRLKLMTGLDLRGSTIIIGLDGWVNAGNASTLSLSYLIVCISIFSLCLSSAVCS